MVREATRQDYPGAVREKENEMADMAGDDRDFPADEQEPRPRDVSSMGEGPEIRHGAEAALADAIMDFPVAIVDRQEPEAGIVLLNDATALREYLIDSLSYMNEDEHTIDLDDLSLARLIDLWSDGDEVIVDVKVWSKPDDRDARYANCDQVA